MSSIGFGAAPIADLVATSDGSDGPSLLVIVLLVLGVLWVTSYFMGFGATVVVVERPGSFIATLLMVAISLGLFYFLFLAPAGWS